MKNKIVYFGLLLLTITMLTGCSTKSAGSFYKSGQRCFQSGNYEDAVIYYVKAIAANPNRAEYYIDYGITLIVLEQYEEALTQFDHAYLDKNIRMVKENNKRAYRGKGIAYYLMQKYEEAITQFGLALSISELSELDMDILYYKGSSLMATGDYQQATEAYSGIITADEKAADAFFNRAYCYLELGDYENSLTDYDKAIALNPDCYDYYLGKYYLLTDTGKDAEAVEILTLAAGIGAKTDEDQYNLAKVHYYQGNYVTALLEFNDSYTKGILESSFYIGEIYREQKDFTKANFYYETLIGEGKVLFPAVYNQLGSCLIKSGNYQEAIDSLEKGISYHRADSMRVLLKNEIVAYEGLGQFDVAKEKLESYLANYPEDEGGLLEEEFLKTRMIEIE